MPTKKATPRKSTRSKRKTTPAKKATSTKGPASTSKAKSKAGDKQVTIDRRRVADRRNEEQLETTGSTSQPPLERRAKVQRRRQIDPTTCERDYSIEEVEFMNAMDEYKRTSGRMFPTCSEVLEVIRDLGYAKLSPAELASLRPESVEPPEKVGVEGELTEGGSHLEEELVTVVADGWTI